MVLVLLAIFIAMTIIGIIVFCKGSYDTENIGIIFGVIGGMGTFVCFIVLIVLICNVGYLNTIDEQIEMYQFENEQIETTITNIVTEYQKYETDYVKDIASKDLVEIVVLYPNLGSNSLVNSQMNIYVENNKIIKELKAKQIAGSVERWWLYFG